MPDYNFLNLSPPEFETLVRDLLQEHLNCHVESFASGADRGIDLRCSKSGGTTIQCKRYSKFSSLLSNLKKEVVKVKELSPKRYILATNVELNPQRKDKIAALFSPFIESTEDILGNEDLNNLLTRYKKIETNHFKLWMSSTNVLQNIISRNILNQSQFAIEEIQNKIKLYVRNDSFDEVIDILEKERYVIISGIPGIGKTTLAEIVVYNLLYKNAEEFVYLSDSIEQGYKMYDPEKTQVFLFDDFLGRNFLEGSINTNEESQIIKFISKIKRSKGKYLIFTTREYILNQAKQKFDLLDREDFSKSVIDLSKYTKLARAQILYNHLYFNEVPFAYVQQIVEQGFLFDIVDHKNYSPRIVEAFTKQNVWSSINEENFPQQIIDLLDNPEEVWKHAFENTITQESRVVLYIYSIISSRIEYNKLYSEVLIFSASEGSIYNVNFDSVSFKKAIKELEGTFLAVNKYDSQRVIGYQNPSIQDFMVNYVDGNSLLKESLLRTSSYLNSIVRIFSYERKKIDGRKIGFNKGLAEILEKRIFSNFNGFKHLQYFNANNISEDDTIILKLSTLAQASESLKIPSLDQFVTEKLQDIVHSKHINSSVNEFLQLIDWYHDELEIDLMQVLKHAISVIKDYDDLVAFEGLRAVNKTLYDKFLDQNYDDNIEVLTDIAASVCDDYSDDFDGTIEILEAMESGFDLDLSSKIEEINVLRGDAEMDGEFYDKIAFIEHREGKEATRSEDNSISDLFQSYYDD